MRPADRALQLIQRFVVGEVSDADFDKEANSIMDAADDAVDETIIQVARQLYKKALAISGHRTVEDYADDTLFMKVIVEALEYQKP